MTGTIPIKPHSRRDNRAAPILFGCVLLICFVGLSWTDILAEELAAAPPLSQGRGFDEQGGAAIYAKVCAACHQPDAKGAVGAAAYPALAENKNLASAEYLED